MNDKDDYDDELIVDASKSTISRIKKGSSVRSEVSKAEPSLKSIDDDEADKNIWHKIEATTFKILHGKDHNDYNTIANTMLIPFWLIQALRFVSFMILVGFGVAEFYIQVRQAVFFYNFHSLIFTTLAFAFLFFSSGKQVVY